MKKIILFIIIIITGGGIFLWYMFNKPVADTSNLKSELVVSATEIFSDFENDETSANSKYLGKIIEVTGILKEVSSDESGMNLMMNSANDFFGINCAMSNDQEISLSRFRPGDQVTIKGKCTGFIGDVVLVRCIVVE